MAEKKHFEAMYKSLKDEFPKLCNCCDKIFTSELDYNNRTIPLNGHMDSYELVKSKSAISFDRLFMRNCECNSTLGLSLDSEKFDFNAAAAFIGYINARAKRNNIAPSDVFNQVREEYNTWLGNTNNIAGDIIIGTDNTDRLDDYLKHFNFKGISVITPSRLEGRAESVLESSLKIIKRNPGRISMAIMDPNIEPNPDDILYHKRIIKELREQDNDFKKHTPILVYSHIDGLPDTYIELDIDDVLDPTLPFKKQDKIIQGYLTKRE